MDWWLRLQRLQLVGSQALPLLKNQQILLLMLLALILNPQDLPHKVRNLYPLNTPKQLILFEDQVHFKKHSLWWARRTHVHFNEKWFSTTEILFLSKNYNANIPHTAVVSFPSLTQSKLLSEKFIFINAKEDKWSIGLIEMNVLVTENFYWDTWWQKHQNKSRNLWPRNHFKTFP